jgi:hypothetical protein
VSCKASWEGSSSAGRCCCLSTHILPCCAVTCCAVSRAGLVQLPSLHGLSQLASLTASFNKLATLAGLLPASNDTIAACAEVAAADAIEAHSRQYNKGARSTASSRPGTAPSRPGTSGGLGGAAVQRGLQQEQQQQHAGGTSIHRTSSSRSLDASLTGHSVYDTALEQHTQQLQRLLRPGVMSALPASLLQLQLAHNQLVALPLEVPAALPALTMLDLSYNR